MRILRCIPSLAPRAGGTVTATIETSRVLAGEGFGVTLASLDVAGEIPSSVSEAFDVHELGPGLGFYGYCPRFRRWLRAHISEFDGVIVEGCWQYPGLAVRAEARRAGVPYSVFPHGMLDPWFKRRYPLKHYKKWLYWPWAEYRVLRDAQAVFFTTEQERVLARRSFGLYRAREVVVPFGIKSPELHRTSAMDRFREAHPDLGDKPFLLFLGRVHEKKGVELLLRAYAESSLRTRVRLVVAGPVADERHRRLLREYEECADVVAIPMLSGVMKWGALAAAEALVLPSHQENFGLVIPEALAMGTPVLTTHPVNIAPIVTSAGCGLVDADTLTGVGNLLNRWESFGVAGRAEMADQARPTFKCHFDLTARGTELASVLRHALLGGSEDRG